MDELNIKELERIPIPEGLEERLSAKIDEWENLSLTLLQGEGTGKLAHKTPLLGRGWGRFSLAASFILVCGIGLYLALSPSNKGSIDTYDDPKIACMEAQKALQLLATNLNKGMAQYEAVNVKGRQAEEILNKQLTKLK